MNELYITQSIYQEQIEAPMAIYNPFTRESTLLQPSRRRIEESTICIVFISFSSERPGAEVAIHELYQHLKYHNYDYRMTRKTEPPWDTGYQNVYYGNPFAPPHLPLEERMMSFEIREGGIPVGFLYKHQDVIKNLNIETRVAGNSTRGLIRGVSYRTRINLLPYSDERYCVDNECKQDIYHYLFSLRSNKLLKNSAKLDTLED